MVITGGIFSIVAMGFIFVALSAAANNFKEDAQITALVAIAFAVIGTGFLNG